ncbi:MAG: beta-lactamase family protein [Chloroflexi bacterium]|nr:beta-lactamase family protein [Chloroflexota bacterium]
MAIPSIDTIIRDAIAQRVFPGAVVVVARGDETLHCAAYGATAYEAPESVPVTPATIYDIASLTKVFTATGALRLYDTGTLDLDAPVGTYLARFHTRDITVRHLLTHTSGLDVRLSVLRHAGREGLLNAVYAAVPRHRPGSKVAYTNINSLLLGEIVATLHGAPLDVALDDLVIQPLGLRETRFRPDAALVTRIAPTEFDHEWRGRLVHGSVHDESAHVLGGVAGHAGLFSTAAELVSFCRSWMATPEDHNHPHVLRRATMTLATTNHTPGMALACGLGWMLDRAGFMGAAPAGSFGHTGFTGPALVIIPHHRLIVVVLSNRTYPRRDTPRHHPVTAAIVNAALASIA